MGILDKISQLLDFSNDEEDKELEKQLEREQENESIAKSEKNEHPQEPVTNVLDFNTAALNKENASSHLKNLSKSEIKTIQPKVFEDAQIVLQYLLERMAVVVNLEGIDSSIALRISDYVSGATCAIGGTSKKISARVILFAPKNIKVESHEDEKKSKNTFLD